MRDKIEKLIVVAMTRTQSVGPRNVCTDNKIEIRVSGWAQERC